MGCTPTVGIAGLAFQAGRRMRMTVKTGNRSHRLIYLVVLLVFAVALTTALVLAGERRAEGSNTRNLQTDTVPASRVVCLWGESNA